MTSWLLPLIGMSLAAWSFCDSDLNQRVKKEVCDTPACNHLSTIIRDLMNRSVEPCDDFYEFVCGNRESVRSSQSIYKKYGSTGPRFTSLIDKLLQDELASDPSPDDILPVKQMKKFYKSCMNLEARRSEGFQKILDEFKKMGGWNSELTWQEMDRHYEDLLGSNAFYSCRVANKFLVIDEPKYVGVNPSWDLIRPALKNLTQLMNAELTSDELDALGKLRDEMVKSWKAFYIDYEEFQNTSLFLKWWKEKINGISEPTSSLANIDWMSIFHGLSRKTNHTLHEGTPIKYRKGVPADTFVHFYASLSELSKTIVNQVQWNFLLEMMPYVNLEEMENIISKFEDIRLVTKSWLTDCLLKNEPASAHLYKKKYNCPNEKIQSMVRKVQQLFNETLIFHDLRFEGKCPEGYDSGAELIDYYEDLTIGESYIENIFNLKKTKRIGTLKNFEKSVPWINSLARVLDSPFSSYDSSLPDYYGYGHLMFKMMSSQLYDHQHEIIDFEDAEIDSAFGCDFTPDSSSQGLPILFDVWVLDTAWKTYAKVKKEEFPYGEMKLPELTGFSDDQMFFISYAQGNCYGPSRVNDILSTNNFFSEAFKCKNNSRMNPEKKCDPYAVLRS